MSYQQQDKEAVRMEPSWAQLLNDEFGQPYFGALRAFVRQEVASGTVYPPGNRIFAAFDHTPVEAVRAVILGQDPYHGPGQANGLCFSVGRGVPNPPSLQNIFKELEADLGVPRPTGGDLSPWADQGVLLLNATLTVRAHQAGSHQGQGWERFTDAAVGRLAQNRTGLVFILWGRYAQNKESLIAKDRGHLIIRSAHPSPLSAYNGFFGSRPFSRANAHLVGQGLRPIEWRLP
jgi:uracil-DNA glycosylase